MRTFSLLLLLCFFYSANSATYYLSANSGDDSRTAGEAQNPSTPWKSLRKLNSFFSNLRAGDAVLLKRGETFYGSIIVNKSGTAASPIVIGAYGSGDKPIITSLVTLGRWTSRGNGIWESYNSSLSSKVNVVLLNGVEQELGRYPNSNSSNNGYLNFDSHNGKTSISDKNLNSSPNWTGAELAIRIRRWVIDRDLITNHSGSKLTFKRSSNYEPRDGYGYFIQNSIKTLDKFGEWYYNPSTKKLSVYFGSNSPSSYTIEAATANNIISASKFSNVVFDNLNIKGANASSVYVRSGSNISIQNCNISFSGGNGVEAKFHNGFKIENSTVTNSHFGGINLTYGGDNVVIRNNKITNTGIFPGTGESGDSKGVGIFSTGSNSTIEYNQVINTGYIGIYFNGEYVTIKNNLVDNFCITKDDGAGIYTYVGSVNVKLKGRKLIGNIIVNGKGAPEGVRGDASYPAEGIYLDNGASGIELTDNTVANCGNQGVYIHCAHEVTMKNNTLFNNDTRQLSIIGLANHPKIRNCNINNNIFFSQGPKQRVLYVKSDDDDIQYFGKLDNNYYARPKDDQSDDYLKKIQKVESDAKLIGVVNPVRFEYNSTKETKKVSLNGVYLDVRKNKYSGSITLKPFTSVVLIKTDSKETGKSPDVSITSPKDGKTFAAGATINLSADASDDGTISKVEFFNGKKLLGTKNSSPYTYSWTDVPKGTYTITAKATDNDGLTATSDAVDITVEGQSKAAPVVRLTTPENNTSYSARSEIKINAVASDKNGTITKVEFYSGSTLLKTETEAPYTYTWWNVPKGTYKITAKATDNDGLQTTSDAVEVTVGPIKSAPLVRIINPNSGDKFLGGASIRILAKASDKNGSISKVEFFNGSTLLHAEYEAPYTHTWKDVPAGNYQIIAVATDNDGNVTTSDMVLVSVGSNASISSRPASSDSAASSVSLENGDNKSLTLKLSPNPARNILNIVATGFQQNEKATISILSSSGTLMKSVKSTVTSSQTVQVDVSSLSNGVYIVKVASGTKVKTQQFVKL